MTQQAEAIMTDSEDFRSCRTWARALGLGVCLLGALVLAGWAFNIDRLKSVLPDWVTMKANAALAFVMMGGALFLLAKTSRRAGETWATKALACGAAALGLLTIGEYVFRLDLGIDQILFREAPSAPATYSPGRMAFASAVSFLLVGVSALLLDAKKPWGRRLAQYAVLPVAGLSLLAIIGHVFGQDSFYKLGAYTAMAFHTGAAFLVLCAGILLARPNHVLASMLSDSGPGGIAARRLIPAAVLIPVAFGLVQVEGTRAGLFDSRIGEDVTTCGYIIVMLALAWWVAGSLQRANAERERVAQAILHAKQEWERTFDAVPDIITIIDDQHRILRANRALANRLGRTPRECVGIPCYEAFHGTDGPLASCPHSLTCLDRKEHVAEVHEDRLGGDFLVTTTPMLDAKGAFVGSVHVARDITGRKKAEEALRRSEEQYRSLVENINLGVTMIDTDYHILTTNSAQGSLFGRPVAEFAGKECFREFERRDHVCPHCPGKKAMETGKPAEVEVVNTRDNGTRIEARVQAYPVCDASGRAIGFIEVVEDITGRRALEQQLMQAQKLEAIGRLASGVAHEINTPTQYIGDNIRFLQRSVPDLLALVRQVRRRLSNGSVSTMDKAEMLKSFEVLDSDFLMTELPRAIEQSLQGIAHVTKIVGAMKEFSHPVTLRKELTDINRALESTIAISRDVWRYVAEVETRFDAKLPHVPCVAAEINQVFLNLLVNAAHAIEDAVAGKAGARGRIIVDTRVVGTSVEVRVTDTGAGIPEAIRGKIFDPFFTTKDVGRGTGQGLAIARSIVVDKHNGAITFETETGQGTTFIVRLPLEATGPRKEET